MFPGKTRALIAGALLLGTLAACRPPQKMADQPAKQPLEPSTFFEDGMASRQPVAGTVARGHLRDQSLLYTGKIGGQLADAYPFPIGKAELDRGEERYNIFCAPCHGRTGVGDGMIVRRGYRRPPSFHTDVMRQRQAGYFFDVISNGFGVMPSYAPQIPVRDRWLIAAYVRALQLSQNATLADVPADDRGKLPSGGQQ